MARLSELFNVARRRVGGSDGGDFAPVLRRDAMERGGCAGLACFCAGCTFAKILPGTQTF